jgi:hypothetical protein
MNQLNERNLKYEQVQKKMCARYLLDMIIKYGSVIMTENNAKDDSK